MSKLFSEEHLCVHQCASTFLSAHSPNIQIFDVNREILTELIVETNSCKIKISSNNLVNNSFSTNKLEISFQTHSTDPKNHPLSKRAPNYNYQFSLSFPRKLVRNAQSHQDLYKKKCFAKTWLRFFLEVLEVRALKPKYEMRSVNHKI